MCYLQIFLNVLHFKWLVTNTFQAMVTTHYHSSLWNIGLYMIGDVSRCRTRKMVEKYCIERSQQHLLKHHVKGIGKRSTFYQWQDKTCLVNAATGHPFESDPGAYNKKSIWYSVKNGLDAFYRFSRPHTVIGTVKFQFGSVIPFKLFIVNLINLNFIFSFQFI